jgi:hypothetical protein
VGIRHCDLKDSSKFTCELRHTAFQPVAVVLADGLGELFNDTGAIIAEDS